MFLIPFDKSPIKAEVDDQFARRNARSHLRDVGRYEIQTEFWGSTVLKALSSSVRGSNEAKNLDEGSNQSRDLHFISSAEQRESIWLGGKTKSRWNVSIPGPQLILAPPSEFSETLVALVVVVEHTVEGGGAQVHQGVVGRLLLLPAGVAVKEVIDLIGYFWN